MQEGTGGAAALEERDRVRALLTAAQNGDLPAFNVSPFDRHTFGAPLHGWGGSQIATQKLGVSSVPFIGLQSGAAVGSVNEVRGPFYTMWSRQQLHLASSMEWCMYYEVVWGEGVGGAGRGRGTCMALRSVANVVIPARDARAVVGASRGCRELSAATHLRRCWRMSTALAAWGR